MSNFVLKHGLSRIPPLVVDGVLALILGAVGAAQLVSERFPFNEIRVRPSPFPPDTPRPAGPGGAARLLPPEPDFLTYTLLGLCAGALVLRRWSPLLTLGAVTGFGATYLARGANPVAIQLVVLVAVYGAVADSARGRFEAIGLASASALILGLAIIIGDGPRSDSRWAMDAAWILAAVFLGDSVRSRRAYELESEKNREEEGRRRVSEERLQIARELHDVVGHNISLINVQAGAGEHVLYKDPQQAREVFTNIKSASHETLQELRSMVGVLREGAGGEAEMRPTQGLDALDQLVRSISDAGQDVQLDVTGRRRPLAGVVDLSAYRILQEALTNTVRHAAQSQVRVLVDYGDDAVSLEVSNTRGTNGVQAEPGGGHGVLGMKERAAALGGRLEAGPQAGGGFRVRAVLPIEEAMT